MPEVDEVCIFETKADQVQFSTQTNGDTIRIKNLMFTQKQATSFAWLVNVVNADDTATLKFRVKVKGT